MTDPTTTEERAAAHRPPIDWWLERIGDLSLDDRGDAMKMLIAYVKDLEAIAIRRPYGISRGIEDGSAIAGVALLVTRAAVEVLQEAGFMTHPARHEGIPWGLIFTCVLLIAPKLLGRATAGKVWGAVGDGLSKLVGRGRPAGPNEKD